MIGQYKNAIKAGIGNSYQTVYTAPASKVSVIASIKVANSSGDASQISVRVRDTSASVTAYVGLNIPVPGGSTIELVDSGKIVLDANDYIEVICNTTGETVDVVAGILEDVNG